MIKVCMVFLKMLLDRFKFIEKMNLVIDVFLCLVDVDVFDSFLIDMLIFFKSNV